MDTNSNRDDIRNVVAFKTIIKNNPDILDQLVVRYPNCSKAALEEMLRESHTVESFCFVEHLLTKVPDAIKFEFNLKLKTRLYRLLANLTNLHRSFGWQSVIGRQQALRALEIIKNSQNPRSTAAALQQELMAKKRKQQVTNEQHTVTVNRANELSRTSSFRKFLLALQWNDFGTFIAVDQETLQEIIASEHEEFNKKATRIFQFFVGSGEQLLGSRRNRNFLAWLVERTKLEKILAHENLGNSTLHYASFSNDYYLLSFLIKEIYGHSRARVNTTNMHGETPLHAATAGISYRRNDNEFEWKSVQLLLNSGALWQSQDLLGRVAGDVFKEDDLAMIYDVKYNAYITEHSS